MSTVFRNFDGQILDCDVVVGRGRRVQKQVTKNCLGMIGWGLIMLRIVTCLSPRVGIPKAVGSKFG